MKVLMLTTNASLMDGINRHILNVAPSLNRCNGIDLAVCTVYPRGELNDSLENQGVKVFSLDSKNGHDINILRRFHKVLNEFKPDIIHVHVLALYEKILLSTIHRRIKCFVTIHGISDKVVHPSIKMRIEELLDRIFKIKYSAVCYISRGVRDAVDSEILFPSVIKDVIYNPIDLNIDNLQNDLRSELQVDKDIKLIGTSCRIASVKNPEIFTTVMCKVLQQNSKVHAVVIGDGDSTLKNKCNEIVDGFGIRERFHWLGFRNDAPHLVGELNCFILTSTSEGLPTSLLESMAHKTPFAFTEGNGGLKDIAYLNKKEGPFCVQGTRENLDEFVKEILKLLEHEDLSTLYSEKAYKVAAKYFSTESTVEKLQNIYNRILL